MLVVQHQDDCPPGLLGDWAAARGVELELARGDRGELGDPSAGHEAVVVLGSDKSVNDDVPWIHAELDWLTTMARDGTIPVLGVCFGAQLLTVALGGVVTRRPPEIAWVTLEASAPIPAGPWLAWHNDFIDPPPTAAILARSERATHAFAQGSNLGVQFHPEVTPAIVEDWMGAEDLGRDLAGARTDLDALRERTQANAGAAATAAFELFDAFARDFAPALRRAHPRG